MCWEGRGRTSQHSQMEPTYAGLPCIHLSRNGIALLSEKLGRVSNSPESPLKLPQTIVKQLALKSQVRGPQPVCSMCGTLYRRIWAYLCTYVRTHALAHSNTCTNTHIQTYTQNTHASCRYVHTCACTYGCIHNTQIHVRTYTTRHCQVIVTGTRAHMYVYVRTRYVRSIQHD